MNDLANAQKALASAEITTEERKLLYTATLGPSYLINSNHLTNWYSYFLTQPDFDDFDPITKRLPIQINRNCLKLGEWISQLPASEHKTKWQQIYFRIVSPHDRKLAEKHGVPG